MLTLNTKRHYIPIFDACHGRNSARPNAFGLDQSIARWSGGGGGAQAGIQLDDGAPPREIAVRINPRRFELSRIQIDFTDVETTKPVNALTEQPRVSDETQYA